MERPAPSLRAMTTESRETDRDRRGSRIVALVDASRSSQAALEAAADLAARRGMELHALFVEEAALLRSAAYPFTQEIGAVSGTTRRFEVAEVEARLHWQVERVRHLLARIRTSRQVEHVFSVRRGVVCREVLSLAGPEDWLILGRVGWSATARTLGSTARRLIREAHGTVVLWNAGRLATEGTVAVLLDDAGQDPAALDTACALARESDRPLTVICPPLEDRAAAAARDRILARHLAGRRIEARQVEPEITEPGGLARVLREMNAAELVLGRSCRLMRDPEVDTILETLPMPVTITR